MQKRGASFLLIVLIPALIFGYAVSPSLKLEEIVSESDVIVKARVISSRPIKETWFQEIHGFMAAATELQVISVMKGKESSEKISFQHYAHDDKPMGYMYQPQYYDLIIGESYLIFAKKTDEPGVYRQLWIGHKAKEDQGVFWTADARPVDKGQAVVEMVWNELMKSLKSLDPKRVVYAVQQLDEMSYPTGWRKLDDFDRGLAMAAVQPFALHQDQDVAKAAIRALGADSPYLEDQLAPYWLAHIGGRKDPGYAPWSKDETNKIGKKYWKDLVVVAEGAGSVENRALALRALGLVKTEDVFGGTKKFIQDSASPVRQAAIVLLSDYPRPDVSTLLKNLSQEPDAKIRYAVARAVGFGQMDGLIPILETLLKDKEPTVVSAAIESLLSFAPNKVDALLKRHKDNPAFKPLFVNALAQDDERPYLDDLAEIVGKNMESKYFRGGTIPAFRSWKILFRAVQEQDPSDIKSGAWDKYLAALENTGQHTSSEPRDLYAFYKYLELNNRAQAFRAKCKKTLSYDMDQYFNMVDEQKDYYITYSIGSNYGVRKKNETQ